MNGFWEIFTFWIDARHSNLNVLARKYWNYNSNLKWCTASFLSFVNSRTARTKFCKKQKQKKKTRFLITCVYFNIHYLWWVTEHNVQSLYFCCIKTCLFFIVKQKRKNLIKKDYKKRVSRCNSGHFFCFLKTTISSLMYSFFDWQCIIFLANAKRKKKFFSFFFVL